MTDTESQPMRESPQSLERVRGTSSGVLQPKKTVCSKRCRHTPVCPLSSAADRMASSNLIPNTSTGAVAFTSDVPSDGLFELEFWSAFDELGEDCFE